MFDRFERCPRLSHVGSNRGFAGGLGDGVQQRLLVRDMVAIKKQSHRSYQVARSLGLQGDLPDTDDDDGDVPLPVELRIPLAAARWLAGAIALSLAHWYAMIHTKVRLGVFHGDTGCAQMVEQHEARDQQHERKQA